MLDTLFKALVICINRGIEVEMIENQPEGWVMRNSWLMQNTAPLCF